MAKILVIRLSAMGDVAMTVPVINEVLNAYPDIQIDMLTRKSFGSIFPEHPRFKLIFPDLKREHKGLLGLYRLYKMLRISNYDAVADLHDVLRSQVLGFLFGTTGIEVARIDKGRSEKKELTRRKNKILKPLESMHQRYADVFWKLGYQIDLPRKEYSSTFAEKIIVGIAPFAAHEPKMWPIEQSKQLIACLLLKNIDEIYLYGGGPSETEILNTWASESDKIINTSNWEFNRQIKSMDNLRMMVSMDSANMHLASNAGVPVVSFWGATHPYLGFLGYGQVVQNCVQRTDLDCRPCSTFGNKSCWRGDLACHDVSVEEVLSRIEVLLN